MALAPNNDPPALFDHVLAEELSHIRPGTEFQGTVEDVYAQVDELSEPLSALCLSGGGIRSAAFGLGVMQALDRFGLLHKFDYLSTVSGGGYIGSWLTAWRHVQNNDATVFTQLDRTQSITGEEAAEIVALRADTNYLTPKSGILSADTWTVIALYIRNLVLNWLIFLPLFMAILLIPRICDAINMWAHQTNQNITCWLLALAFVAMTAGLSRASFGRRSHAFGDGSFVIQALLPVVIAATCFTVAVVRLCAFSPVWTPSAVQMMLGSAVSFAVAWSIATFLLRNVQHKEPSDWRDLRDWALSGVLTGLLLYIGVAVATPTLTADAGPVCLWDTSWVTILGSSWFMLSIFGGELVYIALRSFSAQSEHSREWLARADGWLSAAAISWAVLAWVSLKGPDWLEIKIASLGGIAGIIAILFGSSGKTPAIPVQKAKDLLTFDMLVSIAGIVFSVFLAIGIAALDLRFLSFAAGLLHDAEPLDWKLETGSAIFLAVVTVVFSHYINVNRFSLHATYRNRLIRGFLGPARARPAAGQERNPDRFTGFDERDNPPLADMPRSRPFHVINTTLNVVSSDNQAWQERKAEPFSMTPLAVGNRRVGYRNTARYGDPNFGISLGTAMAVSGAAVSPNMGYHSSPVISFLLMLFNVRLGWWLGNPSRNRYRMNGPASTISPLLRELAGQTNDDSDWVYLSDGGHFENLGVYEMIQRRCKVIVVSDAGQDPKCAFEDLSNAVRKVYIDLGVSIDLKKMYLAARQTPSKAGAYCALGRITYPNSPDEGWLLYIKPSYYGIEPVDIQGYANAHATFPHETTANQFFTESQFEAYRSLGAYIVEHICNSGAGLNPRSKPRSMTMDRLRMAATSYLETFAAAANDS
jgi:hypothetical protein